MVSRFSRVTQAAVTYATKSWQTAHGLLADGVVGTHTLTAAEVHLTFDSDGDDVNYHGSAHTVYIGVRDVNGAMGGILGEYYIDSNCCEGMLYEATYAPLNQNTQGYCGS